MIWQHWVSSFLFCVFLWMFWNDQLWATHRFSMLMIHSWTPSCDILIVWHGCVRVPTLHCSFSLSPFEFSFMLTERWTDKSHFFRGQWKWMGIFLISVIGKDKHVFNFESIRKENSIRIDRSTVWPGTVSVYQSFTPYHSHRFRSTGRYQAASVVLVHFQSTVFACHMFGRCFLTVSDAIAHRNTERDFTSPLCQGTQDQTVWGTSCWKQ